MTVVVEQRADEIPVARGYSRGTSRPMLAYGDVRKMHRAANNRTLGHVQRDLLRMRGGSLSQRVSVFSSPVLVKEYFPRVARPLLVDLTEARQQMMARQGIRVPPPSPVAAVRGKGPAMAASRGGGGGFGRSKAAHKPTPSLGPRFCCSCRKPDELKYG